MKFKTTKTKSTQAPERPKKGSFTNEAIKINTKFNESKREYMQDILKKTNDYTNVFKVLEKVKNGTFIYNEYDKQFKKTNPIANKVIDFLHRNPDIRSDETKKALFLYEFYEQVRPTMKNILTEDMANYTPEINEKINNFENYSLNIFDDAYIEDILSIIDNEEDARIGELINTMHSDLDKSDGNLDGFHSEVKFLEEEADKGVRNLASSFIAQHFRYGLSQRKAHAKIRKKEKKAKIKEEKEKLEQDKARSAVKLQSLYRGIKSRTETSIIKPKLYSDLVQRLFSKVEKFKKENHALKELQFFDPQWNNASYQPEDHENYS